MSEMINMNAWRLQPLFGAPLGFTLAGILLLVALGIIFKHYRDTRHQRLTDQTWASVGRRSAMALILAFITLVPSTMQQTQQRAVSNIDVIIAVDTTGSMAVVDAPNTSTVQPNQAASQQKPPTTISRLEAAKHAVGDILATYPHASFTGMHFAANATVDVPLTPDALAMRNWSTTLSVQPTALSAGSRLDTPLDALLVTARRVHEQHPHDAIVVYLLSDGEQTSPQYRRSFSALRQFATDAFVIGVGSSTGGKVPLYRNVTEQVSSSASQNAWVQDPTTHTDAISRRDDVNLRNIADEMNGMMIDASTDSPRHHPSQRATQQWHVQSLPKQQTRWVPVVWPLALALTVLLLAELLAWVRLSGLLISGSFPSPQRQKKAQTNEHLPHVAALLNSTTGHTIGTAQ